MRDVSMVLIWYGVTLLLSIGLMPIVAMMCRPLWDHGVTIVRPVGLLLVVWPVWLLASVFPDIVPFNAGGLWLSAGILSLAGWVTAIRIRFISRQLVSSFVTAECWYGAAFGLFILYRGMIPIRAPLEETFNLMMMASVMKSDAVPPPDAWLSGYSINYYYLGYSLYGGIGKMAGLAPAEAYNVAFAMVVAMTVVAAAGLIRNTIAAFAGRVPGVLVTSAGTLVVFLGPPFLTIRMFDIPELLSDYSVRWPLFDILYRIIPADGVNAITESFWVSLRSANLQPYKMALPYMITTLCLGLMMLRPQGTQSTSVLYARSAAIGVVVGSLLPQNSWDFPTGLMIAVACLLLGTSSLKLATRLGAAIVLAATSLLAWLPFQLDLYTPLVSNNDLFPTRITEIPLVGSVLGSLRFNDGPRTTFSQYFSYLGLFWAVLLAFACATYGAARQFRQNRTVDVCCALALLALCTVSIVDDTPVLFAAGLPIVLTVGTFVLQRNVTMETTALALGSVGLGFTIATEYFYFNDVVGSRVNTIFKYYYQATLLLGVASALALLTIWARVRATNSFQVPVAAIMAGILVIGLSMPVIGFRDRINTQNPDLTWRSLDALYYVEQSDPGEYAAIDWLWENGEDDDVMLAAGGCYFLLPVGRPAAGSGVSELVGWSSHEWTWRYGDPETTNNPVTGEPGAVIIRSELIPQLFADPNAPEVDDLGITLIYVGAAETNGVPVSGNSDDVEPFSNLCAPGPFPEAQDPAWPGAGWIEVFNQDGTRIYRRIDE